MAFITTIGSLSDVELDRLTAEDSECVANRGALEVVGMEKLSTPPPRPCRDQLLDADPERPWPRVVPPMVLPRLPPAFGSPEMVDEEVEARCPLSGIVKPGLRPPPDMESVLP